MAAQSRASSGGGGGGGGGGSSNENHMAPIWIIIALFVAGLIIWSLARGPLIRAFCYIKLGELSILKFFIHTPDELQNTINTMLQNPLIVSVKSLEELASVVGHYIYLPLVFILILLSIILFFRSSTSNYRHSYDMHSLLAAESVLWPQTLPVLAKNLVDEPLEQGAWAMAMTPIQFAHHKDLLREYEEPVNPSEPDGPTKISALLKSGKAREVFIEQLDELWTGLSGLKPHVLALFAVFAARICEDETAARELIDQIARSSTKNTLDFSGAAALAEKYINNNAVQQIIQKHGYIYTVMASLLETAREGGVLATVDFIWLKPLDRPLWYMLNGVGRQTVASEIAGPFAHWLAEKAINQVIKTPMIEEAVAALEITLAEIVYEPAEKNKK